ncbi:MAG TPA: NTP transferase domain-containing protein, partial [Dongiaceae bacterium]|nr:NTP transferase domain-containing protein [Dongiaceae bacterium]
MRLMNPVVLIPARMASQRLPDKPLADIAGKPMIVHVWERAREAGIGPVYVAAAEPEIAEAVKRAGGDAVLTRADHPSGSDRIFEALTKLDPERRFDTVVNVQGDLPTLDPRIVRRALEPLA